MRETNIIEHVTNYNNNSEEQQYFIDTVIDCINTRTQFLELLNAFSGTEKIIHIQYTTIKVTTYK